VLGLALGLVVMWLRRIRQDQDRTADALMRHVEGCNRRYEETARLRGEALSELKEMRMDMENERRFRKEIRETLGAIGQDIAVLKSMASE
jgi:hypothetical protein